MTEEHTPEPNNQVFLDPLTGIFNREYFDHELNKELQRAIRYGHPLSILLLDIDDFGAINEEFGYQLGDRVLKELSKILKQSVRAVDIVARYEDDKFIILLPETKKEQAKNTAERLLRSIRKYDFFKEQLKVKEVTVSIGGAGYPEDAAKPYELMKIVDNALYQAKQQGGCRVVFCA